MKTPDQFSTKQLFDLFDAGQINVEQLNHLTLTLRADREEYARQAEEYQRKYQREHIDTNRWKNRAELAEARIELANAQQPVLAVQSTTHGKRPSIISQKGFDKLQVGDKLYARPIPAQQSPAMVMPDCVLAVVDAWKAHEAATDSHNTKRDDLESRRLLDDWSGDTNAEYQCMHETGQAFYASAVEMVTKLAASQAHHLASPRIIKQDSPGVDFEDLQRKKNDPFHMAVSNWYVRLTYCDAVADEGEHVGYCCSMKMMDELEEILAAPLQEMPIQDEKTVKDAMRFRYLIDAAVRRGTEGQLFTEAMIILSADDGRRNHGLHADEIETVLINKIDRIIAAQSEVKPS